MEKLHFEITINAPKEKVWNTMLGKNTYPEWTDVFGPGSNYVGDWNKGSKILFTAPGENGEMGMVSRIKENRPYEFISIEHMGMIQNGVEDTTSEAVKAWAGAHENYTFKEKNGKTEVIVDIDTAEEYSDMFNDMWPKALQKLKELSEKK
ncbi:MAG TPA: SRPBCC domain-containing protein [Ignavibacteriaceae bacterium]|nr:SRPBCC domain-containing protein [Ignavibacteriaceae bacterium]